MEIFPLSIKIFGVYHQAKEILHLEQSEGTRWELHQLGRELFEVRSAWRREIVYHVSNLHRTEESNNWFGRFFQIFFRKGKDEKIAQTVSGTEAEIQLINGSLAIHLALAQVAGTLDTFLQISLPYEITELQRVCDLLYERRNFIHEKHPYLQDAVADTCRQLEAVTSIYRSMVMPRRKLGVMGNIE